MILRSDTQDHADFATINAITDLSRTRRSATWPIVRRGAYDTDGHVLNVNPIPLDVEGANVSRSYPMLAFSSPSVGELREVPYQHGSRFILPPGRVGSEASASFCFGDVVHAIGTVFAECENDNAESHTIVDLPVEWLLVDMYVDKSLPFNQPPTMSLYNCLTGHDGHPGPDREPLRMPCHESVINIGDDPSGWSTPLLPRHRDMISWTIHQLGRRADQFKAYRFQIRYPMIPTAWVMKLPLVQPV